MSGLFSALAKGLADWRRRSIARAELAALDDRALADIGLRRSDIPFVLAGARAPGAVERPVRRPQPANVNAAPRHAA